MKTQSVCVIVCVCESEECVCETESEVCACVVISVWTVFRIQDCSQEMVVNSRRSRQ